MVSLSILKILIPIILITYVLRTWYSIPRLKTSRNPFLFLKISKEIRFFETLLSCHKETNFHLQYLILPKANNIDGRDSEAVLRTLYHTYHPGKVISQMQKIGFRFLGPLTNGKKRLLLRRVINAIKLEIPESKKALIKAYRKSRRFKDWDTSIQEFFLHTHIELEKESEIRKKLEELWINCSELIIPVNNPKLFFPETYNKKGNKQSKKITDVGSEAPSKYNEVIRNLRLGLLGGLFYMRNSSSDLASQIPRILSVPNTLNSLEASNYGQTLSMKGLFSSENSTAYGGFPVVYIGGELYRQYILLSHDKTDILTSLQFISLDAAGSIAGTITVGAIAKELGLQGVGIGFVIYKGVKMAIKEVKKQIYQQARRKYKRFLNKREQSLVKSALKMMANINKARDNQQMMLDSHPYNITLEPPNRKIQENLLTKLSKVIIHDMEKVEEIDIRLQKQNSSNFFSIKSLIISIQRRRIRRYMVKNIEFLTGINKMDQSGLQKHFKNSYFLPVLNTSDLNEKEIPELSSLIRYSNYYMLALMIRVLSLYGLFQNSFTNLVAPIFEATENYDMKAKEWAKKTQTAYRKLQVKASQVDKILPNYLARRPLPLLGYRQVLKKEKGKWIYVK